MKSFNQDQGTRKFSVTKPLKDSATTQFKGMAQISFKIGDVAIVYKRPLSFNEEFYHSNNINLRRLQLKLKMAPRAYFQSQPLVIAGIPFDCMYAKERMVSTKGPGLINIHEGDEVMVDLSSENFICAWVHVLEFEKVTQVKRARAKTHKVVRGQVVGDINDLYDYDNDTSCQIKSDKSKAIIEYDFGKEITLNGLDANYRGSCFLRVWCKKGDKWVPVVWDNYTPNTSQNPRFPDTKAALWRVEVQPGREKKFSTLRFYYNPNRVMRKRRLLQFSDDKYSVPIQPN